MTEKLHRYPGAKPFETSQQNIFFGREKDVEVLCRKLRQEPLTVLYSKSGMGKSSLLNAGVVPAMEAAGEYRCLRIRFNAFNREAPADGQLMPILRCRETVRGGQQSASTFLDKLIPDEPSLWHDLKEQQLLATFAAAQTPGLPTRLLLLFDQFEELFTYPPEAVLDFRKQLAEALYTPLPGRYWDVLDLYGKDNPLLDEAELQLLQEPLGLRVIMAIRQDRMHLLGQLSDYLPSVSKTWYELRPLDQAQARAAILQPAALKGNFRSAPFGYEPEALEAVISFLTDKRTEPVESTQLQIICDSLERRMAGSSADVLRLADVGDLESVIENYYLEKIATVGSVSEQMAARRLVEEGLVYEEEERRLSLYEGIILKNYGVSAATLRNLVDCHLLRAEPSLQGGYTYELSHDTLVAPVLKAKARRKEAEGEAAAREAARQREVELAELRKKAEEERQQAAQERALRAQAEVAKKEAEAAKTEAEGQRSLALANARRAAGRTRLAVLISALALALAGLAGVFYVRAAEDRQRAETAKDSAEVAKTAAVGAKNEAEANLQEAERQRQKALAATQEAEKNYAAAQANLRRAEQEEKRAKAALAQVEREKAATEAQRRIAEENYAQAQEASRLAREEEQRARRALAELEASNRAVVRLLLKNVEADILVFAYDEAYDKVVSAASLKAVKDSVAAAALELAFWYGESGRGGRADTMLQTACGLLDIRPDSSKGLRAAIEAADGKLYGKCMRRYYPLDTVLLAGDTFEMGCKPGRDEGDYGCEDNETLHQQTVSSFIITRHEISWWQYRLFCEVTQRDYQAPSWGIQGDNPAIYVSWYDAVEYANWVSNQLGLPAAYSIDKNIQDSTNLNKYDELKWTVRPQSGSRGYRLPTEAEWEYAARGGQEQAYAGCSSAEALEEYAWYDENSKSRTQPVKSRKPNAYGLYDMSGNVWEWCWDWYGDYPAINSPDYAGPTEGSDRVIRGGSWGINPVDCRVANRIRGAPDFRNSGVGFRLVLVP